MIVLCQGFTAKPLPDGKIELKIDAPSADPLSEKKYSMQEIADAMGKTVKAIDKLSRRKRNPLPLVRGNGRPFAFKSTLNRWLSIHNRFPLGMGDIL